MGGHSAGALNYGYEPVPDFLFLIKKPFSVIPLRGGCGLRVSRSFSLNYEMFCWPLVVSEARGWESGTMRTQEATGRAGPAGALGPEPLTAIMLLLCPTL